MKNFENIDSVALTIPTGDPFADAGGYVIEYLSNKFPEKSIKELIEYVTRIYVNNWGGKLNSFFLNSKITQPAFVGVRKIDETIKYFDSVINNSEPFTNGYCRITGRETELFIGGRDNTIMTGSGTFVNFHHFFQKGISLSKEALIRFHFVPFACQQLQGKISLLQSSNSELSKLFVRLTVEKNLHEIGIGISDSVGKSEFNKPANAIFGFVDDALCILKEFNEDKGLPSLTLYHFSNFGASPEIKLYQLPAKVFLFYKTCMQPKFKDDWQRFVRSHYVDSMNKGAKYDFENEAFILEKAKENKIIEQKDYKQWFNRILNKLLQNESIRPEILRWVRRNSLNFEIVSIYQQHIIGMKKETVKKIRELAVFLVKEEDTEKIKKRIKSLDAAKNASALRRFILKDVVAANFAAGNNDPIISLEEFIYYLFPDGSYWGEIRDLLLIAIYQELHERNLNSEDLKIELTSEQEDDLPNE